MVRVHMRNGVLTYAGVAVRCDAIEWLDAEPEPSGDLVVHLRSGATRTLVCTSSHERQEVHAAIVRALRGNETSEYADYKCYTNSSAVCCMLAVAVVVLSIAVTAMARASAPH